MPGGRLVVCGGTSGQMVEVNLPRLFFKQHEIIGSTMGGYEEFAEVTRLVDAGPAGRRRRACFDRPTTRRRSSGSGAGTQLGKIVLRHPD